MKQRKEKLWGEEYERDGRALLKLDKEPWKEMFPHSADILKAE